VDWLLTTDQYYKKINEFYTANPPPGPMHRFDTRVNYPFREATEPSVPDILYRTVPVGTPTRRKLFQAISTEAGTTPAKLIKDIGSGVPQKPIVRELYVDGSSGLPICKILIFLISCSLIIIILFFYSQ
jgi:hypothetical protein